MQWFLTFSLLAVILVATKTGRASSTNSSTSTTIMDNTVTASSIAPTPSTSQISSTIATPTSKTTTSDSEPSTSKTTDIKTTVSTSPTDATGSLNVYIAVACACGIALVITLVLLSICIIIWRKKLQELSDENTNGKGEGDRRDDSNVLLDQLSGEDDSMETEEDIARRVPIPITEFSECVKKKHFNANIIFEDEFSSLSIKHKSSYTAARQKSNDQKNRFENIFPYDFSRVVLKQLDCREEADYINASYINGYNRENAYIAAQGPLRNTIVDFWRMVWENRLTAIVMLTETIEAGRDKCAQYWPALMDTPWNVGDNLSVTLQMQTQYAAYRVKIILLENESEPDSEPLTVTHFHFSAWPDHGVPADKTCLIQFIQRVRKDFPYYDNPPLVVHCSAGVGRSGTFIVLDSMLERMKVEDSLDIYAFICEMRKKRALMVQTEAQYSFIHDALEEFITCGDTSIAVTNIRVAMVNLNKSDGSGQTGYGAQLELLENVSYKQTTMNCNEAEKEYNCEKNRYKEHVPYNINRVFLRPGGTRGADYINASFIDGYKHRKNFIATQGPLENTVNEFWRMIWEHKSHVIVMLCNLEEEGEESCYKYWPDGVDRIQIYGKYKVKMLKEEEEKHFKVRKFEIGEDTPYMVPGTPDAVIITQFNHTNWPRRGVIPSSASILDMINSLLKIQMSTGNHAIVVMCNNGAGRTGTFTTIYSQIERIKAEQVADIFQYIKGIRFQRADMVLEESHFRFCHQVLADYLDSVDNYANFKDL